MTITAACAHLLFGFVVLRYVVVLHAYVALYWLGVLGSRLGDEVHRIYLQTRVTNVFRFLASTNIPLTVRVLVLPSLPTRLAILVTATPMSSRILRLTRLTKATFSVSVIR